MTGKSTLELVVQRAAVSGPVRHETFDGRDWLVVPVVAVVEGVLNGELVPAEGIARSVDSWNGRPVTIGHPENQYGYVTANEPGVFEEWAAGWLFHCAVDGDRLKGEMWLDLARAQARGGAFAAAVAQFEAGQRTEVSTGYFRDVEFRDGIWNGEEYSIVAVNIYPDHLAILLDAEGACNWDDGCGAPRVNADNSSHGDMAAALPPRPEESAMTTFTINTEISLDEQLSRVYEAFWDQFERADGLREVWPREVFDEVVIAATDTALLAYPYAVAEDGEITFGSPRMVEVVYQDAETGESVIGNASVPRVSLVRRAVESLVSLLAPAGPAPHIEEEAEGESTEEGEGAGDDEPPDIETPAGGQGDDDDMTAFQDFIETLGGQEAVERDILALRANNAAARQQRIGRLAANARCAFTAEDLAGFTDEQLTKLETSLVPADYSGQGLPRVQQVGDGEEVLAMPAIPSKANGASNRGQ